MAKDYKRSIYNRYSTRLSNRFSHETMAKAHPKNLSCRQKHNFNATGNRKTYEQGGYIASTIQSRGLLQSPILSSEKRRLVPPCNRLKSTQQIYNKRTLSNGKSDVHKAPLISKRLHGQIRPERRLFSSGDSPTITTVPSVYLAGANLSVSMPTVRAKHGTAHFYKTTETRGGIPSHTKHQTSHLPRRHPNHRVISKNPTTTHNPSNGIATEPRFYNQLREVEAHALPSSRISGIRDKLEHNEILPTSREGSKRSKSVPISSEGESNITSPSLPTSRFSGILSPSSLGSPTPFQTLTTLSNTPSSVEQWGVSGHSPPRSPSTGGTPVVDQQHETGEWERNMPCNDRDDDHLRRLKNGVGCHIRQAVNQRALVTSGNPPPHQCLGTESYFFSCTNFPETPLECIGETPPRQHNGGCLYKHPRVYSLTQSCLIDTRSMEMVSSTQHFDICGIPSGHLECSGGQRISNLCGFERLETTTTTNTALSQRQGDRSLCVKANAPATTLCELAPRPLCSGHGRIFNRLGPTQSLRVPTIQSHSKDFNESDKRQCELTASSASVASSTLVATLTTTHSQAPSTSPLLSNSPRRPIEPESSSPNVPSTATSRLDHFQQLCTAEGLSDTATRLLSSATRQSTNKTYDCAWTKWNS